MQTDQKNTNVWTSWNENVRHTYNTHHAVKTEEEIIAAVKNAPKTIRVYGSKQSSADIAAGTDTLINIADYNQILHVDEERMQMTVQSGITLKVLINAMQDRGWSIPCLPDIDTVTLGGALATGTHGTGRDGKLLSEYVIGLRLILADGTVRAVQEGEELMDAVRVSLGMLGVMSEITLQCEPVYTLHLKEKPMRDADWLANYEQMLFKNDFTRILWMPHTDHGYVILGNKIDPNTPVVEKKGPDYLKHRRLVSRKLYAYTTRFPRFTTIANKIIQRLFFSSKKEYKGTLYDATVTKSRSGTLELAEWTIALSRFPALFKDLKAAMDDSNNPAFVHIPMDIRFVREDNSWLSYAYGEDCVTIGCVTRDAKNADNYAAFKIVEEIFLKHGGRPHWGKRFDAKNEELRKLYPRWEDFKELRYELDPEGKFLNSYLTELFDVRKNRQARSSRTSRPEGLAV